MQRVWWGVVVWIVGCDAPWSPQPGNSRVVAHADAPWIVATTRGATPGASFDRAMLPMSGTIELFVNSTLRPATRMWNADATAFTLQASPTITEGSRVRVVIGADVKSGAGIPMHGAYAFAYTFGMPTMGGDPCITDNTPPVLVAPSQPMITLPGGSTGYTATLVFSEPVTGVDTIGVTTSAGSLIVSGSGTTYLATLSGLSDAQTYTVTVTTAIQDRCAWFLSSSYQLSITVEAPTGGGNIFSTSTAYPIVETGVDAPSGSGACLIAPSGVTGSVQTLTGTGLVIGDLDVRIESDHHWASDIEAWLRFMPAAGSGPVCAILVRDEFGGSWFVDHTFDDGAPSPSGSTASTGTFAPETPLSVFNGLNADGTWTLFANDDGNVITGSVTRWSLMVTP